MDSCLCVRRRPLEAMVEEGTAEEIVDLNESGQRDDFGLMKANDGSQSQGVQYRRLPDNVESKFQEIIIPPMRREKRGARHPPAFIKFDVIRVTTPER